MKSKKETLNTKIPTVFISYSWDDEKHKSWVKNLSYELSMYGIRTVLDQNDLKLGDRMPLFMEKWIIESDFTLIICTPLYKEKADKRMGGVGYEEAIIASDVLGGQDDRKYITVLASGKWETSSPTWARGKLGADLSSKDKYKDEFKKLVNSILGNTQDVAVNKDNVEEMMGVSSYDYLFQFFSHSSTSLQVAILQNICNICNEVDLQEYSETLFDFCLFLDKIDRTLVLDNTVRSHCRTMRKRMEQKLRDDMEDLWQDSCSTID